ncbi:MAG: arginine deiminase [Clostridia bacterium]|nr:arginine deiminase [Clostridia bacterium]
MNNVLNVTSEIGRLKTVLLHRPGKEVENLTPDLMERLLFDDIPYLKIAREEHDAFAKALSDNGVEVLYLEDLTAEAIADPTVRAEFIEEFLFEGDLKCAEVKRHIEELFATLDNKDLVDKMMAGIRKTEIAGYESKSLAELANDDYPFVLDPMPNLYFTRDPFATIGNGITLNHMRTVTRRRETIFAKYIFNYHPRFKGQDVPKWLDRNDNTCIEGGDELILAKDLVAVGISQRTDAESVEKLARSLFEANTNFETVLAFKIPASRAFMHLDTVFTMVDYDKFTIHPGIEGPLTVFSITKNGDDIVIKREEDVLENILAKYLKLDKVTLIRCAGGDVIDSAREQWNDGSNTLAIAPGKVVVYSRNYVTNEILKEHGIETIIIPSSELSRGRGGPRCMSMPLVREDLN